MAVAEIAGDIVAAGSAVAGLTLVYIGSLTASYSTFQPTEKRSVSKSYRRRVWFAFVGLVLLLAAVAVALIGKLFALPCAVITALVMLLLGLAWVLATAVFTALEIN